MIDLIKTITNNNKIKSIIYTDGGTPRSDGEFRDGVLFVPHKSLRDTRRI